MDNKDLLILKMLMDKPGTSLVEVRDAILVRSVAAAYYRVHDLEEKGYINPPPHRKMARSRSITKLGIEALKINHMI